MNAGEARSSWRPLRRPFPGLLVLGLCAALAGCTTDRAGVKQSLRSDPSRPITAADNYVVGYPDVLEVRIPNRPELSGRYPVTLTGRLPMDDYGDLRVTGRTLPEVARLLAEETGQKPNDVDVRVVEFKSQQLFLFGQVVGWQRSVPYVGQETVLDLLRRAGGIAPGAEPNDVYVVRAHIADSQRPEVFHVDLKAILLKRDDKTNIHLMPFDQIYVGEARQMQVDRLFPPWLRPVYEAIWGIRMPRGESANPAGSSATSS
jgi:protein involved in polysaccharide export with SLBB domain